MLSSKGREDYLMAQLPCTKEGAIDIFSHVFFSQSGIARWRLHPLFSNSIASLRLKALYSYPVEIAC